MSKGKVNHYKPVPKHVHIFKCSSEMLFGFVIKNFHNTCKIVGIDLLISFICLQKNGENLKARF